IGMILQRFELIDHTNYELKIKESLSIKPDGFKMKVKLRDDIVRSTMVSAGFEDSTSTTEGLSQAAARPSHGTPALVLYGSNLGTTEDFARDAAREAEHNGFDVTLAPLDEYAGKLPKSGAVLIACSSYNGSPPDNAAAFLEWLEAAEPGTANGVHFAVFGCGHSDWASTYMATPRQIDEALERLGGTRLSARGEGDARDDIDEQFTAWTQTLWPDVVAELGLDIDLSAGEIAAPLYEVEVLPDQQITPLIEESGAQAATVLVNRELQTHEGDNTRSTRHIEVALPEGATYQTGDHLAVVPRNAPDLVQRVERRFGFAPQTQIKLATTSTEHSQLPTGTPVSVRHILTNLVELQSAASRKDVQAMVRYTDCPHSGPQVEALAGDSYKAEVLQKRQSLLDLMEQFPACEMPFGAFLERMPMLNQRYYSISSAPMTQEGVCAVTVGVVDEPAWSGNGQYRGVCSNYLARQDEGAQIYVTVKATKDAFHLPADPKTPVIMIGPGTGIAPFRGFLQERAADKGQGKDVGDAMLFFGCRHPDQDFLYRDELEGFDADGVAALRVAFSRQGKTKTYVQDVLRTEREAVWAMIEAGAHIYVCGDGGRMEPDVRRALTLLYAEEKDVSAAAADAWLEQMITDGRYALDVWVSG
ncbi:MAG: flavodoxin domain-containing protein, partial [Rhodobacteraceae bacterium]|nr:flavodoxin domain-containing protein [Paracoccaceae bacterium]